MPRKVIVLGGQGDPLTITKAIVAASRRGEQEWEITGFLNDKIGQNSVLSGFRVFGGLHRIHEFFEVGFYFLNGIFLIDGNPRRIRISEEFGIPDSRLENFVHPTTYVAPSVTLGPGCIIMPNVSVSLEVTLGNAVSLSKGQLSGMTIILQIAPIFRHRHD